jgi:hypothetical protein
MVAQQIAKRGKFASLFSTGSRSSSDAQTGGQRSLCGHAVCLAGVATFN